jgi:hypothetical protein
MGHPCMTFAQRVQHVAEQQRKAGEARAASDAGVERAWRGLPPERDEAAPATVEALMLSLRSRGVAALAEDTTQRRLADLSTAQVREVIRRLDKLRPRYPQITDELIAALREQV